MDGNPMEVPCYIEEYFKTPVVGGMVFDTLMCGDFNVLHILNNLRILDQ